jgi:hypothetical protein
VGLFLVEWTYASMKPMGTRLRETLYESVNNYSEVDFNKDFENIKNEMPDIIDVDFSNVEESDTNFILFNNPETNSKEVNDSKENDNDSSQNESTGEKFSVADELLKFKQLLDMEVITQEEFDKKKQELLNS